MDTAEQKKEQILQAAFKVLLRHGIEGFSLSRVAANADITTSLIFHYFENKHALILALTDKILEQYALFIEHHLDQKKELTPAGFERFVDSLFTHIQGNSTTVEGFYACYYMGLRDEAIRKALFSCLEAVQGILYKNLALFADKGFISLSNAELAIGYIISCASGLFKMFGVEEKGTEKYEELIALHKKNILALLKYQSL